MILSLSKFLTLFVYLVSNLIESSQSQEVSVKLNRCVYNELYHSKELQLPNIMMGNNQSTAFRLQEKCPTRLPHCLKPCQTETIRRSIPFDATSIASKIYFTPTGFLRYGSDFFHRDEYCIFKKSKTEVSIEFCRPDCGKSHVCVPKCCTADKVFDFDNNACVYSLTKQWEPLVYENEDLQVCGIRRANIKFHYYQSSPSCQGGRTNKYNTYFLQRFVKTVPEHNEINWVRFRLLLNGSIVLREILDNKWTLPKEGTYCLDGVQNFGSKKGPYNGDPLDQVLIVCAPEAEERTLGPGYDTSSVEDRLTATGILYSVLLFSGTPFLLATVIVYILLWTKQNVHGWTIFSHTLAILLNYLGQGITNTVSRFYDSHDSTSATCKLLGIANHYFCLCSFFWLTMINYDLWSMFRHLQSTVGRSRGVRRFVVYMIIGWGVPFLAVVLSIILDTQYGLYGDDGSGCTADIVVPLYGLKRCYMTEEAMSYYVYYPIVLLMIINLVFATLTIRNMYKHKKSTKLVQKKSTKHKRKFSVWSKLFVVMGVALMSELVVWNLKETDETLPWYLVFPDFLSFLQAVAIFILFVCKQKIINQLHETYPSLRPLLDKVRHMPCYRNQAESTAETVRVQRT